MKGIVEERAIELGEYILKAPRPRYGRRGKKFGVQQIHRA